MTRIAFLGTGTMGMPIARNLTRAGHELRTWNRSADRARPLADEGVEVFDAPGEAAAGAEVMITMLSDADAVAEVGEQAVGRLGHDALWVQMSTIGIAGLERCAELAEGAGVTLVDAPVLGTREPAEEAKLVILASGPADAKRACDAIFEAIGSRTLWLGEAGAGTRCKIVTNSWIVGVVGVLAETIALAEALDVDPHQFFEAVRGGALDLPYARLKGAAMIERAFDDPAFKLALARKDAELVLEAAARHDLELPIMEAVAERLRRSERDGHGDEDMAATYWATAPEFVRTRRG